MTHQRRQRSNAGWLKWPWLCGVLALALLPGAWAADALYENDGTVIETIPPDIFQTPDATNFVNNGWFQLNFGSVKGSREHRDF